jgi:hypothetical protein
VAQYSYISMQVLKEEKYWEVLPLKLDPPRYLHCAATYR